LEEAGRDGKMGVMQEPASSEAKSVAPPAPSKLSMRFGRVAPVLGALAILLTGFGLGAAWERLLMHELLPLVSQVAVPFLAGVGTVLVGLSVGLFVLKRVWAQRLETRELAEAKELVGQELERAVSVWVYEKRDPAWEEGRAERLKRLRELVMAAGKVGMAALGLRSSVALVAVVLGGTVAFASLLVSYMQISRLDRQNRLIEVQNQLTVQDQESQALRSQADAAYEQLAGILLDMESTEQAQIFALERIPEAMRMAVPRAKSSEEGRVEVVVDFPNLERLRGVLRAFMRQDRAFQALRRAGVVKPGQSARSVAWEDFEREVVAQGEVSDALVEVLHRLGPEDAASPKEALWTVVPGPATAMLPKPRSLPAVVAQPEAPKREEEAAGERVRSAVTWYELMHLEPNDLRGVQLPFLFARAGTSQRRARFPARVVLNGARLDGANLEGVDLTGAFLEGASLRRATLKNSVLVRATLQSADLRGAELSNARLHAAWAPSAWFQGASLVRAQLWGARLNDASLEGANLANAELNGADLFLARLNAAQLQFAQFVGALLSSANLSSTNASGADFTDAHLRGTSFVNADLGHALFHDASLEGGDLRGARLVAARFQATTLRMKTLEVVDFEGNPVRVRDETGDAVPVGAARVYDPEGGEVRIGRTDLWRVPAFEKAGIRWLAGNWGLEPATIEKLGWEEAEPKALPADFEQEVVPRLRRQPTAVTDLTDANFEGVAVGPILRAALGARAPKR
jgi:uncharacterized protein YjbI with pentapeptide repeats